MRSQGTVFGSVLVTVPKAELHDSLDTKAQAFQLLQDDTLGHLYAQAFKQQTHTAILRKRCENSHSCVYQRIALPRPWV